MPATASPKPGEKVIASSSVKPERPIEVSSTMVLRFRYRTNVQTFVIRLGKYSAVYTSHVREREWGGGEISLDAFMFEGTPPQRGEQINDIQFQAVVEGKSGKSSILDVDGIQFLRRSR